MLSSLVNLTILVNKEGKVVVILDKYPDVLRLVELSPQTQLIIARKMQEEMQKSGLKDVTVRVVNGVFWIEGIVESKEQSDKAEQIAKAYLPDQIQNLARRADAVQQIKRNAFENMLSINQKPKPEPPPATWSGPRGSAPPSRRRGKSGDACAPGSGCRRR